LPVEHVQPAALFGRLDWLSAHPRQSQPHRHEGIPELVGERRKELVLALALFGEATLVFGESLPGRDLR
jgi:hypothetical protein